MKSLQDKVALVTGGAGGVGKAILRRLSADGARIAVHYRRSLEAAETLVAEINGGGNRAAAFHAELSDTTAVRHMVEAVVARFGRIDILVNNAALFQFKPLADITSQHYRDIFDTNVWGTVATTQACVPHMGPGGRIVNMSSTPARGVPPGCSLFASSKAALDCFTRAMAQELGPRNITVNGVALSSIPTPMTHWYPPELWSQLQAMTALHRIGTPQDVADVVAWLVSDEARWISGKCIEADGGFAG